MEGGHPLFVLTGTRCSSLSVYIVKSMKPAAAVVSLGRNISPNEDVVASDYILKIYRVSIPHMSKTSVKFGTDLQTVLQPMVLKPNIHGTVRSV